MSTREHIERAAALLKDHWIKGRAYDGEGNYCLVGALDAATDDTSSGNGNVTGSWTKAITAVSKQLPAGYVTIPQFNDATTTTEEDVLNLLRRAAEAADE